MIFKNDLNSRFEQTLNIALICSILIIVKVFFFNDFTIKNNLFNEDLYYNIPLFKLNKNQSFA